MNKRGNYSATPYSGDRVKWEDHRYQLHPQQSKSNLDSLCRSDWDVTTLKVGICTDEHKITQSEMDFILLRVLTCKLAGMAEKLL